LVASDNAVMAWIVTLIAVAVTVAVMVVTAAGTVEKHLIPRRRQLLV
jgi:hypothetical protein